MSLLRHIQGLNPVITELLVPWAIDGRTVGWIRPSLARQLAEVADDMFRFTDCGIVLEASPDDFDGRSAALAVVVDRLRNAEPALRLLDEPYPVTPGGREQALCTIDRGAVGRFGVRSFGQHVNGFVRDADGLRMWLARRARDRRESPGLLDQLVAGGLPHGVEQRENLRKECLEEAGIPAHLADRANPVSALSYNRLTAGGFRPDILYCYDLELSSDWTPRNNDGEVEEFLLLPIDSVMALVRDSDEFKPNCNLVIIDFLVRHGLLTPEHEDYLDIVTGLHAVPGLDVRSSLA